jgi:LmbE family N-acetylglucosaminyl deacetylase
MTSTTAASVPPAGSAGPSTPLTVDDRHLGTPEVAWQRSGRLGAVAPLLVEPWPRVVVVVPHPDDEVLGAGGLIGRLVARGTPVEIVAVTDGEGSHPGSPAAAGVDLPARRAAERAEALRRLTGGTLPLTRLGLPDGAVAAHEDQLRATLAGLLGPDAVCLAPWCHDGHPDHDSVGRAALDAGAAQRCDVLGFMVWTWHWADPDGEDVPWSRCRRLELTRREVARKRWATAAFDSQTRPLGPDPLDGPVLPDAVVRRSWRRAELFVVGPPS